MSLKLFTVPIIIITIYYCLLAIKYLCLITVTIIAYRTNLQV